MFDYEKFVMDIPRNDIQLELDGMGEECGEIFGVIKRMRRGDYGGEVQQYIIKYGLKNTLQSFDKPRMDLLKEIGDLHYYITRIILEIGVNREYIELLNRAKYENRLEKGNLLGKGSNRESD